jgi:hypothetical protein
MSDHCRAVLGLRGRLLRRSGPPRAVVVVSVQRPDAHEPEGVSL